MTSERSPNKQSGAAQVYYQSRNITSDKNQLEQKILPKQLTQNSSIDIVNRSISAVTSGVIEVGTMQTSIDGEETATNASQLLAMAGHLEDTA